MNRFWITLVFLAGPLVFFGSNHQMAAVELRMLDRSAVFIEVDGFVVNRFPSDFVRVRDLRPGQRHIRVLLPRQAWSGTHTQILYDGFLRLAPGEQLFATMDRRGRFQADRQRNRHPYAGPPGQSLGRPHHGQYFGNPGRGNSWNQGVMPNRILNGVERQMRRSPIEQTKEQIARTAVRGNRITARQLRNLLYAFNFESTRVSFARWALPYVVNPERIHIIYDAFTLESSIRNFDRHVF